MFEGLERISATNDWITLVLVIVLLLITLIKNNYNDQFSKLFSLLYSDKYYTDYIKIVPLLFNRFHFLFLIVIIFNISLFILFIFKAYYPLFFDNELYFFTQILGLFILYIFIRYFVGLILGNLFDISESQKYFTFLKISNLSLLSVLILPLLILINFSVGSFHRFLITFSVIIALLLSLFRYFVLLKNEKLNFSNLFYLFLYLCALELAPFIVIYKLFVD